MSEVKARLPELVTGAGERLQRELDGLWKYRVRR
jgi:hypothetical protein